MKKEAMYAGYAFFLFARAASRELVECLGAEDVRAWLELRAVFRFADGRVGRRRSREGRRPSVLEPLDEATAELLG